MSGRTRNMAADAAQLAGLGAGSSGSASGHRAHWRLRAEQGRAASGALDGRAPGLTPGGSRRFMGWGVAHPCDISGADDLVPVGERPQPRRSLRSSNGLHDAADHDTVGDHIVIILAPFTGCTARRPRLKISEDMVAVIAAPWVDRAPACRRPLSARG